MKIAVPVINDDLINEHFGKSESFNIYTVNNDMIESVRRIPSFGGSGCKSGIADTLAEDGVTVILAAGIGGGAMNKVTRAGIEVISGCQGAPVDLVNRFIKGELKDEGSSCHKHDHHHNHDHTPPVNISGEGLKINK